MKKWLAFLLAACMVLALLAGCGSTNSSSSGNASSSGTSSGSNSSSGSNTSGSGASGNTAAESGKRTYVRVALTNTVNTLSPYTNNNPYSMAIKNCTMEKLAERVDEYGFIPILLKSYEQTADDTYACEIYDYIYDSENNHLTSSDVKYSFDTAKEEGLDNLNLYVDVNIKDDSHFDLVIVPGLGNFELLCESVYILTEAAYSASADRMSTHIVGTGPYLNTMATGQNFYRMEKNENYWQTPELTAPLAQANVDVIDFNILNEVTQMGLAVEDKAVDLAFFLNDSLIEDAEQVEGYVCTKSVNPQMRGINFNCSELSILGGENGKLLRQAICYAINNEAVIAAALYGNGSVPKAWGSDTAIGYNKAWESKEYYPYNPEKAKELMAEAGYPDGFSITWYNSQNNPNGEVAQVVMANLADVGITVDYQSFDGTTNGVYRNDYTSGWDLENGDASIKPYLISTLAAELDNRLYSTGRARSGLLDEHLQELFERCSSYDYTQADLDELYDYCTDLMLNYQFYAMGYVACHTEKITDVLYNYKATIQVGACTFADDYDIFFEDFN